MSQALSHTLVMDTKQQVCNLPRKSIRNVGNLSWYQKIRRHREHKRRSRGFAVLIVKIADNNTIDEERLGLWNKGWCQWNLRRRWLHKQDGKVDTPVSTRQVRSTTGRLQGRSFWRSTGASHTEPAARHQLMSRPVPRPQLRRLQVFAELTRYLQLRPHGPDQAVDSGPYMDMIEPAPP